MDNCPYCKKLIGLINETAMEFSEINVDLPENVAEFTKVVEFTKDSSVPTIIVGKNILVPEKAFNTIEEGFELIKRLHADG